MYQCRRAQPAHGVSWCGRRLGTKARGRASRCGMGVQMQPIPPNAAEIIKQWSDVHGLPVQPSFEAMVDGYPRQVWVNAAGDELIEFVHYPQHGAWNTTRHGSRR